MIARLLTGYIATCSRCGKDCPVKPEPSKSGARKAANAAGWKVNKRGQRRCPACRSQSTDATEHAVPNTTPPGTER